MEGLFSDDIVDVVVLLFFVLEVFDEMFCEMLDQVFSVRCDACSVQKSSKVRRFVRSEQCYIYYLDACSRGAKVVRNSVQDDMMTSRMMTSLGLFPGGPTLTFSATPAPETHDVIHTPLTVRTSPTGPELWSTTRTQPNSRRTSYRSQGLLKWKILDLIPVIVTCLGLRDLHAEEEGPENVWNNRALS